MSTKAHIPSQETYPTRWILDWDGTITKKDTLDTLVNIAANTKPDFPTQDHWKRVSKAYMDDYTATLEELAPNGYEPTTIEGEKALLKALKEVEQRSLDRVGDSELFAGLRKSDLETGASNAIKDKKIKLREGFSSFYKSRHWDNLTILSVNWSRHFIYSCLKACDIEIPPSAILSNELSNITSGLPAAGYVMSANPPHARIVSSSDKLRRLEDIRQNAKGTPIVYVGDSWTDIECLLAADYGICIRDEPMGSSQRQLAEALERLGVQCLRLKGRVVGDDGKLFWAKDFTEIEECMKS
jgi:2-hydroxy-3-keto-5-methylthiopentenyl-1-phosphate phosphatase